MASRAGTNYESLLLTRVIGPLKLKHTAFVLSPEMKTKLAVGHDASLQPPALITAGSLYGIMPAAGLLYSTVNDLLTVMSVAMGYQSSPLGPAIATMLKTRRPMGKPGFEQALGWVVIGEGNDHLIFHDGGSLGYSSVAVWDPAKSVGVAVLSNHVESVADVGRHLLQPDFALKKPMVTKHIEISLDAGALKRYAGRYQATGEGIFEIKLEGNFLTFQAPADWGLPKLRLHPESPTDFFAAELPLRVTVQSDGGGQVNEVRIHPPRGQHVVVAQRVP
jgi:serine-type D-Ala-D-Ala carboxypeptidase/endopeptidase